ncbi:MAG: UDP-N-acetylmuramate dehydrogenase [Spirochaetaceae bacterium]|nr:MAG: UDP-N-acetylmuramate dehydrogenase [Spirochaetaceae bacterium]
MDTLKKCFEKINIRGEVSFDEPLARHTTFRVGGPADVFVTPADADALIVALSCARENKIPVFLLGGGANILVSDRGIRGVVVSMQGFSRITHSDDRLVVGSGLPVSDAAEYAAAHGLEGLGFLYSMPGSVGGALWMNARCYGSSISDIIEHVDIITEDLQLERYTVKPEQWNYKISPFQTRRVAILEATFRMSPDDPESIRARMECYRADRDAKGHFSAPSAGSVFKNNREFGEPTGAIIDKLGLRGFRIGDAKVSDVHANIVVNAGHATARDVDAVIHRLETEVSERLGLRLEREVLRVGEWD